jgi:hypothetical protein
MKRLLLIVVCACAVLSVGTAPASCDNSTAAFVFPVPDGWHVQPDSAVYGPQNLWEYIDGAADLFVSYSFERLECATYRTPSGAEVRAELYRHADAVNAYGMYSQERSPENASVATGTEGYADAGMLNVVIGPWYLKLSAAPTVSGDELFRLAVAFDTALGSPRGLPKEFDALPSEHRVPRSEQFIARDFLGYGFLANVCLARFGDADGPQVFVIKAASPEAVEKILTSFVRVSRGAGKASGSAVTHVADPHQGPVDLIARGETLFGIIGWGKNEPLRQALLKKLQ